MSAIAAEALQGKLLSKLTRTLARSTPKETVARFAALPVHSSVDRLLSPP